MNIIGAVVLTGLSCGQDQGDVKYIIGDTQTVTLTHNDIGSSVGNRFNLPNTKSVTIPNRGGAVVMYDSANQVWELLAVSGNINGANAIETGTAPTASSCGAGPTFATGSNNGSFTVTTGAAATDCTITFAESGFANNPTCVVTARTGANQSALTYTTSTTALTMTTVTASSTYDVICRGHP